MKAAPVAKADALEVVSEDEGVDEEEDVKSGDEDVGADKLIKKKAVKEAGKKAAPKPRAAPKKKV